MGFWSTLGNIAGVGLSLIPGVGPIAGGLIKAATGIGGAIGDSMTGGGPGGGGGTAGQVDPALNSNLAQIQKSAATGSAAVDSGVAGLNAAKRNYQTGANGSLEELQSLYNPEISTVLSQYDNAAKAAAEFGPRGGGRTALMAELPFKKASAAGQVIGGARAGANAGLAEVSGKEAQIGSSLTGQATSSTAALLQPKLEQDKYNNENSKSLGTGIGGILGNIFLNKKGKGTGGFSDAIGNGGSPIPTNTDAFGTDTFGS